MNPLAIAFLLLPVGVADTLVQLSENPPVIAKMEELGTVYVTRQPVSKSKKSSPAKARNTVIIGIDFRPMAGSDQKRVAAAVKELVTLPDLESVLLLGKDVTDEAADAIPSTPKLSRLQFFNTGISDKGIANLVRLKSLKQFHFTGMGLTDVGMQELAKIKTLQTIIITDAKVTDVGVLALQTLPALQRLTVENTEATQRSIDRLRESLPGLTNGERFLK